MVWEGVYIGYRFYEMTKKDVLFPFGHGLSYTTFDMNHLVISSDGDDTLIASLSVRNVGAVAGAEVVQLYVTQSSPIGPTTPKELKAFKKISLEAGSSAQVEMRFFKEVCCQLLGRGGKQLHLRKGFR